MLDWLSARRTLEFIGLYVYCFLEDDGGKKLSKKDKKRIKAEKDKEREKQKNEKETTTKKPSKMVQLFIMLKNVYYL